MAFDGQTKGDQMTCSVSGFLFIDNLFSVNTKTARRLAALFAVN